MFKSFGIPKASNAVVCSGKHCQESRVYGKFPTSSLIICVCLFVLQFPNEKGNLESSQGLKFHSPPNPFSVPDSSSSIHSRTWSSTSTVAFLHHYHNIPTHYILILPSLAKASKSQPWRNHAALHGSRIRLHHNVGISHLNLSRVLFANIVLFRTNICRTTSTRSFRATRTRCTSSNPEIR